MGRTSDYFGLPRWIREYDIKAGFETAIGHGVVKVILDTDLQYAHLTGIRDFVLSKKDYIMQQVEILRSRVWVREGEKTMSTRVKEVLHDFNTANQL
ncbi:unnamed protein product [Tuber melanosporum]|uniref:Fructose-bisphosphate aldolase n=1 Tax=Tuber melanosporum (strain Mel28) TaxID=656061 RepID=D5G5V7_TUBMM|nr:uncharacterized protein GSTUM_00001594001 [Tuber melanosporum]CAZ79900.1 unnamed protein product [Tuber melanosporum]